MYNLNPQPKNEEELNEFFVTLNAKAKDLGVEVDFSRADVRDAEHLNCVWYGGVVGTIKYKNHIIEISARGEIRLSGTLNGHYFEAVEKRGAGELYYHLGGKFNDEKFAKALYDGIYVGDINWFEVNLIAPDNTFIDLSGGDNILDDNILECFCNFENYFKYVDDAKYMEQSCDATDSESVYAVISTWASKDDIPGNTVLLYTSPEAAKAEFDKLVNIEKTDVFGYIGGKPTGDYEVEESDTCFEIWLSGRYYECFSKIEITKLPVNK